MPFEKNQSAGYLINRLARVFAEALALRIKPLGLVPGQFPILLELWRQEGLTQKQLVERLGLEQATIANTLARMERDGLVVRRPHPEDGRAQLVRLTARARALEGPATEAAEEVNRLMLAPIGETRRKAFLETMQAVVAGARSADD